MPLDFQVSVAALDRGMRGVKYRRVNYLCRTRPDFDFAKRRVPRSFVDGLVFGEAVTTTSIVVTGPVCTGQKVFHAVNASQMMSSSSSSSGGGWNVIPTQEGGSSLETTSDHMHRATACRIVLMTMLGISIGFAFIALRGVVGFEV